MIHSILEKHRGRGQKEKKDMLWYDQIKAIALYIAWKFEMGSN